MGPKLARMYVKPSFAIIYQISITKKLYHDGYLLISLFWL